MTGFHKTSKKFVSLFLMGVLVSSGFPTDSFSQADLLGDLSEEDLLDEWKPEEEAPPAKETVADKAFQAHKDLFAENRYPSASTCATCHPKHYREWSVSQHAYAQLSPIYMSMQNAINKRVSGSNGDFCIRCHNQVGMNLGEPNMVSNLIRHPTSREGITCIVCHRVDKYYNKVSGRIGLVEGGITDPVFGPTGNEELKRVLDNRQEYRVVSDPDQPGRKIHGDVKFFEPLKTSTFCGSCHDVNLFNGFRLEEAFSDYRMSPAAKKGVTCQDCHMGQIQGKVSGFEQGPAAMVGGVPTKTRRLTNHLFSGPDYSVIHPGLFPHNVKAQEMASLEDWLKFDVKAGWGTPAFENNIPKGTEFPPRWRSVDDRYDARAIINEQLDLLEFARKKRVEVLRNGYGLGQFIVKKANRKGLAFEVEVKNLTDGHNVPTGFIAERMLWLEITVKDPEGRVVFRSGDTDPNGDVRDLHSRYVHNGERPLDKHLFSLQSRFLIRSLRGGEQEQILAVPFSVSARPRILPSQSSTIVTGQPRAARTHRMGIEPLGNRWAEYEVKGNQIRLDGSYEVDIKMWAQMVPVNLVAEISDVGFDYGMSPREVAENLVAGRDLLWSRKELVTIKGDTRYQLQDLPRRGK